MKNITKILKKLEKQDIGAKKDACKTEHDISEGTYEALKNLCLK